MKTTTSRKSTPKTLCEQVTDILQSKGLSKIFNQSDFLHFERQSRRAFHKAEAIVDLFLEENKHIKTDFHEYIF